MKNLTLDGKTLDHPPIPVTMGRCSWCGLLHPISELKKCKGFKVMPCYNYICLKCLKEYPGDLCPKCDGELHDNTNLKECDGCGEPLDREELKECPDCGGMCCEDCLGWSDDGCDKLCPECRKHRRETTEEIEAEMKDSNDFSKKTRQRVF